MRTVALLLALNFFPNSVFSESALDQSVLKNALSETQQMLTHKTERENEADKTPAGKAAISNLENLGGSPEINEEMFALAAEFFEEIFQQSAGDPVKIQKAIEEAQKDPGAFAKKLSAKDKEKIHSIATRLPSN